MIDLDDKDWIKVCEIRDNEICFTKEYLDATKGLGGKTRQFIAHLIGGWDKKYGTTLDYFGPMDKEKDWYSGIDGEPMDVNETIPEYMSYNDIFMKGLDTEWYRDIMRAKLVSLKLPKKLIDTYIKTIKENKGE